MDMGLGKTATTLAALVEILRNPDGPVILVGPIRVIESVWRQEAELWPWATGIDFALVRGSPAERRAILARPAQVYLVNPELIEEALVSLPSARTLVVDESSMFKNPSSKRFKILRKYLKRFARRYILTGTPTPNGLLDLWSQIFICDLGERLGTSFYQYRERFFEPADYMGYTWKLRPGSEARITKLVSDIVLRIDAATYLEPRTVLHRQVYFDLPSAAARAYKRMEKDALVVLKDKTISTVSAAAALMKLRQIASGFVYDEAGAATDLHDEKHKALREIIDETGSPVIVVYNFERDLAGLRAKFREGVQFSSEVIPRWNAGKVPLMFLHPKSGGHGVNLQHGGHTMVVFSGSFSQEEMSQTFARIDRQGQKHPVLIHHLTARDTVDELLYETVMAKTDNQSQLLERIKRYAQTRSR